MPRPERLAETFGTLFLITIGVSCYLWKCLTSVTELSVTPALQRTQYGVTENILGLDSVQLAAVGGMGSFIHRF